MSDPEDNFSPEKWALRLKAEKILDAAKPAIKEAIAPVVDEILHELKVHQVELEMQNEELRQAHASLEQVNAHYRDLYDFAPIGYVTLNMEGLIQELNLTAAKLLGMDRKKVINQSLAKFVADDYKDLWYRHFQQVKKTYEKQGCELPFTHGHGSISYYHLNCQCTSCTDSSKLMRITFTDVTEGKKHEEQLRIAAAAFDTQESIIVTDTHRIIQKVNNAFTMITGFSPEEAIGKSPAILHSGLHDEDFYEQLLATVKRDGHWRGEIWNKRKNGEIFPVLQSITAVFDDKGQLTHYVGSMVDITAQKQAEKVLLEARKRLENQVATTQEELDKIKSETLQINAALNVLLRQRESEKTDLRVAFTDEVEATVLPLLKKLKVVSAGRLQTVRLIKLLEDNLQLLVKSYGQSGTLTAVYQKLTPIETQVAAMIRQGQPTKVIAAGLNIAPGTVSIHRKHIRKKLGLDGKKDNLHSHLKSLTE